ncbi:MAG: hypothetical protein IT423_21255 [Pirellulaceae bacterium]|nr:hypothetical protein [Pirellulaceae bacterium]
MQKIKLFKSIESELHLLEDEVNAWIESSGARIISMTGNISPQTGNVQTGRIQQSGTFSPSDVLLIVLYEVGNA